MKAATVILIVAVIAAASFALGLKVRGEWEQALVAAATKRLMHDCSMPCPIPEDRAMNPHNPKGKSK
jgi:hypothetical protein